MENYLGHFRFTTPGDAISDDATSGHFRWGNLLLFPVTSGDVISVDVIIHHTIHHKYDLSCAHILRTSSERYGH